MVDKSSSWGWRGGVGYVTPQMIKDHLPPPSPDTLILVRPFWHVLCWSLSFPWYPATHTPRLDILRCLPAVLVRFANDHLPMKPSLVLGRQLGPAVCCGPVHATIR